MFEMQTKRRTMIRTTYVMIRKLEHFRDVISRSRAAIVYKKIIDSVSVNKQSNTIFLYFSY